MNKPEALRMPADVRAEVTRKIRLRRQLLRELNQLAARYDVTNRTLYRIAQRATR